MTLLLLVGTAFPQERFPRPEFASRYTIPNPTTPGPRAEYQAYLDIVVLIVALMIASLLALKIRSRSGLLVVMVLSLLYFGWWRGGCVCAIGALQNVALAVADPNYQLSLPVAAFFFLPLLFTLFCGRTFCAAVCPLGAMQDLLVLKPLKLPLWLERSLGLLAPVYLALAVLFAATGAGFFICRFDPFIAFFRLNGSAEMLLFGAAFLALGLVIARPYCRFVCPYGVLLRWVSSLSKWHVTISPEHCVRCRLCEDACPFGAITAPTPERHPQPRATAVAQIAMLLTLAPLLLLGGAWLGSRLHHHLARQHPVVLLAEEIEGSDRGAGQPLSESAQAFRSSGIPKQQLLHQAHSLRQKYRYGGAVVGGFLALVFTGSLLTLAIRRRQQDYLPNRSACISCGRCFSYCPIERQRRRKDSLLL